jgi:hypothetical protein
LSFFQQKLRLLAGSNLWRHVLRGPGQSRGHQTCVETLDWLGP